MAREEGFYGEGKEVRRLQETEPTASTDPVLVREGRSLAPLLPGSAVVTGRESTLFWSHNPFWWGFCLLAFWNRQRVIVFEMLEPKESLQAQRWHQLVRPRLNLSTLLEAPWQESSCQSRRCRLDPGLGRVSEGNTTFALFRNGLTMLFSAVYGSSYFFTSLTTLCII